MQGNLFNEPAECMSRAKLSHAPDQFGVYWPNSGTMQTNLGKKQAPKRTCSHEYNETNLWKI